MKKNTAISELNAQKIAHVHSLSHDGRGIATIDHITVFIQGALPGEDVIYRILKKHRSYLDAEIVEVINASSERVKPACQHFGVCGGCSLQHMNNHKQLELKQQVLLDQLKHFGKVIPETILAPLSALSLGYRRKARLGVKYVRKKQKVLVGFREKSSPYLADLSCCEVLHPSVGKHLSELSELVASLSQYQSIPQIEVAIGDEEKALIFRHLHALDESDIDKLMTFAKKHHIHLYLQPNAPESIRKIWPDDHNERLSYSLPDEHLQFNFYPTDFTQVNLEMNRLMVKQALTHLSLEKTDTVLDLFCGLGNFSLAIAPHVHTVVGIEGSQEMVVRAIENAQLNRIPNVQFYAANLMEKLDPYPWTKQKYTKILLDPPRSGAKEMLEYLPNFSAPKIVYVSCNLATLARDAGIIVHEHQYRLTHAGIMNMFPHTTHVEAMAVFEK